MKEALCLVVRRSAGDDSARPVLDSTLYFGRDLDSGLKSSSLDPVDSEPRRKTLQDRGQFDRLRHAQAMSRSSLPSRLPFADRCKGYYTNYREQPSRARCGSRCRSKHKPPRQTGRAPHSTGCDSGRQAPARDHGQRQLLDNLDVQEESAAVRRGVATALVRAGGQPCALWLPTIDRAVAARRLEGECEAHLPAVHGGAVGGAHQAATQDGSPPAWKHSRRDRSEPVLEQWIL